MEEKTTSDKKYGANGREYKLKSRITKKSSKWWWWAESKRSHSQYWSQLLPQITSKHTNNTNNKQTHKQHEHTNACTTEENRTNNVTALRKLLAGLPNNK